MILKKKTKNLKPNIFYPAKQTFKPKEQKQTVNYVQKNRKYFFHEFLLRNEEQPSDMKITETLT